MTIDRDFPGKASHRNMFFMSRSVEFNSVRRRNVMGKDAKGKGKTCAKKVEGGNVPLKNKTLRNRQTA